MLKKWKIEEQTARQEFENEQKKIYCGTKAKALIYANINIAGKKTCSQVSTE